MDMTRKTEMFDDLAGIALKPITENARDYFPIMDSMELAITLVNVMEELKSVVSQYGFAINYNYYLCEKSEMYMDSIIKEKVCITHCALAVDRRITPRLRLAPPAAADEFAVSATLHPLHCFSRGDREGNSIACFQDVPLYQ